MKSTLYSMHKSDIKGKYLLLDYDELRFIKKKWTWDVNLAKYEL